jgi:hypothetical protein
MFNFGLYASHRVQRKHTYRLRINIKQLAAHAGNKEIVLMK